MLKQIPSDCAWLPLNNQSSSRPKGLSILQLIHIPRLSAALVVLPLCNGYAAGGKLLDSLGFRFEMCIYRLY